jgi:Domain of unknown function (DUF4126)
MHQDFVAMFAGFGFATAAGLNAWITLLFVSVAAKLGFLTLSTPSDVMTSIPIIVFLAIMVLLEGLADKIPGVDHASHIIHFVVQPAAGAILFASQAGIITTMSPVLAFIVGALVAGTIHATRATVRPAVTVTTAGMGNAFVSVAEDAAAATITIATILAPVLVFVIIVAALGLGVWLWRRRRA